MSESELDDRFDDLMKNDIQIKYSLNAIKSYKIDKVPDFIDRDIRQKNEKWKNNSNLRRHIVGVDDISRINYEMIKNSPGNLINKNDIEDNDFYQINTVKTKLFKDNLYKKNDDFIMSISTHCDVGEEEDDKIKEEDAEEDDTNITTSLSLDDQKDILYKIQNNLFKQYKQSQLEEKKWFILKELLLDANIELDIFSQLKKDQSINLGSINPPNNNTLSSINAQTFKRRKRSKESYDIL